MKTVTSKPATEEIPALANGSEDDAHLELSELSHEEAWVRFDAETRRYLSMSSDDFVRKFDSGFWKNPDSSASVEISRRPATLCGVEPGPQGGARCHRRHTRRVSDRGFVCGSCSRPHEVGGREFESAETVGW